MHAIRTRRCIAGWSFGVFLVLSGVTIIAQDHFRVPDVFASAGGTATFDVECEHSVSLIAFSVSLAYEAADLTVEAIRLGPDVATFEFFRGWHDPAAGEIAYGGVSSLDGDVSVALSAGNHVVMQVDFQLLPDATLPSPLSFVDGFGDDIPVNNVFTNLSGRSVIPEFESGLVHETIVDQPMFHRADANADGGYDLSDPIFLLNYLFAEQNEEPPCLEAADVNNSGGLDISDPIAALNHLFGSGDEPPPPGPPPAPCGADPDPVGSPGDLGCLAYDAC